VYLTSIFSCYAAINLPSFRRTDSSEDMFLFVLRTDPTQGIMIRARDISSFICLECAPFKLESKADVLAPSSVLGCTRAVRALWLRIYLLIVSISDAHCAGATASTTNKAHCWSPRSGEGYSVNNDLSLTRLHPK
jgi:hypothetical protein